MADQDGTGDDSNDIQNEPPSTVPERQANARGDGAPKPTVAEANDSGGEQPEPKKSVWREIRILDGINTLIGLGTLATAIAAMVIASDTSDIKRAVQNISALATQTKREADELHGQFGQIRREADALSAQVDQMKRQAKATEDMASSAQGQLGEVRQQTKAISEQTSAIKNTSAAEIRSAQAQQQNAVATMQAHKPALALSDIQISGLNSAPDKTGFVAFTIKPMFRNIGGSTIVAPSVVECLMFAERLPDVPNYSEACSAFGGNDLSATAGIEFGQPDPAKMRVSSQIANDVNSGKLRAFVFGSVSYKDVDGLPHTFCFADGVIMKDGSGGTAYPAGGARYHCEN